MIQYVVRCGGSIPWLDVVVLIAQVLALASGTSRTVEP